MRFFNSVKALYAAVGILFIAFVLGYYLDIQNEAMHARHLEISTSLERIIRLEQELTGMLSLAVVEHNELRVIRHETVRQDVEASIKKVIDFTKDQGITQEISALSEGQKKIRDIEEIALQKMRSDRWKEARDILFGDEYLTAKKTYEIDSEAIPGVVLGELDAIEKRFNRINTAALAARIGALCLLLWTGIMFSRRTRADLDEQVRLQTEISAAKEVLEERVVERTKEVESAVQKINAMSQAVNDALLMIDSQGKVLYWNQAAEKLFGYTASEAMGKNFHEMAAPVEVREKAQWGVRQFAETGQGVLFGAAIETIAINQAGNVFPVEVNLSPFQLDDKWFAVGTVRDITKRKAMEEAIHREQERLQGLMDGSPICVGISTGGILKFANPQFLRTLNIKIGDPITKIYLKPDDRVPIIEALQRDGIVSNYEIRMHGADGSPVDIMLTFLPTMYEEQPSILGWLVDITSLKQKEKELKEKMEELERFIRLTVGREKQMIHLKAEINLLLEQEGKEKKYKIVA